MFNIRNGSLEQFSNDFCYSSMHLFYFKKQKISAHINGCIKLISGPPILITFFNKNKTKNLIQICKTVIQNLMFFFFFLV